MLSREFTQLPRSKSAFNRAVIIISARTNKRCHMTSYVCVRERARERERYVHTHTHVRARAHTHTCLCESCVQVHMD